MTAIPILMYHNIAYAPQGVKAKQRGLFVPPCRFDRQMTLLRLFGYQGLSMAAAMPYLRGERQGRIVVITFDDGYRDTLEHALPVLQRHSFSATCYVVSDAIGGYNHWDSDAGICTRKALMDVADLRMWQAAGMELGAHSRQHRKLPECSDRELVNEITGSRQKLEDIFGGGVTQFCYPYGAAGSREITAARSAGFTAAVTTSRGRARPGMCLHSLPRVTVSGKHGPHKLPLQVLTPYCDVQRFWNNRAL
ncbi:MAG: polysaccharide deacetylase family protein [Gammaproteobacteria bacterium]